MNIKIKYFICMCIFLTQIFIASCNAKEAYEEMADNDLVIEAPSVNQNWEAVLHPRLANQNGKTYVSIYRHFNKNLDLVNQQGELIQTIEAVKQLNSCNWKITAKLPKGEYVAVLSYSEDATSSVKHQTILVNDNSASNILFSGKVLHVGPKRMLKKPSEAAKLINNGDVIEIDEGTYKDDIVVWRKDNLYIRGLGAGAHINSSNVIVYEDGSDVKNGKGIWVTKGENILIENIQFSGAKVPDENGAGIRIEGAEAKICKCKFNDNENGILGGVGKVLIEYSEFSNNGLGEYGRTHNVYISGGDELIFQFNNSNNANIGHLLKTRARTNYVLYNRLVDEKTGSSSYSIDVPNGGKALIMGNLVQQGQRTENQTIISFGAESIENERNHIKLINNTVVNDRYSGIFVYVNERATAELRNNYFVGTGEISITNHSSDGDVFTKKAYFKDRKKYDYGLTSKSPAVNMGVENLMSPNFQYQHPALAAHRLRDESIDVGALEYSADKL